MTNLPTDICEPPSEIEPVAQWWAALSEQQRQELLDCSDLTVEDFKALDKAIGLGEVDASANGATAASSKTGSISSLFASSFE